MTTPHTANCGLGERPGSCSCGAELIERLKTLVVGKPRARGHGGESGDYLRGACDMNALAICTVADYLGYENPFGRRPTSVIPAAEPSQFSTAELSPTRAEVELDESPETSP